MNHERVANGERRLVDPKLEGAAMAHILDTVPERWARDPELPVLFRKASEVGARRGAVDLYEFPNRREMEDFLLGYNLHEEVRWERLPQDVRRAIQEAER